MKVKKILFQATKLLLLFLGVLAGLLALLVIGASIVYSPEYVYRIFAWGETDVGDYRYNFPKRNLEAAAEPYHFSEALDASRVRSTFELQDGIDDLDTFLADSDTQAFIVIQDGGVLYEQYFNGVDRDTPVTSFSVVKSFVSALIGKAIEEGYIHSVDDPITDYLPELAERDPAFTDITIRHLLMMASGLEYEEMRPLLFNSDDILTSYYPDQREISLENTHIVDPPGEYFRYNKYHPQLLGMILERSTSMSVTDYTQRTIWDPLGMEFDGWWSLDSEESGFEKMETGLNARAIDFAKFGQLFLNGGEWSGQQVLSADWVAESTGVDPSVQNEAYYADDFGTVIYENGQGYYKYFWYGYFRDDGSYDFAAEGDHAQLIYVSPHKELVIVRNGASFGLPGGMSDWINRLYQFASDF